MSQNSFYAAMINNSIEILGPKRGLRTYTENYYRCFFINVHLCAAMGLCYNSLYRTTIGYFSNFSTSITNAYSAHFVKSSGLNAKAKFRFTRCILSVHLCAEKSHLHVHRKLLCRV